MSNVAIAQDKQTPSRVRQHISDENKRAMKVVPVGKQGKKHRLHVSNNTPLPSPAFVDQAVPIIADYSNLSSSVQQIVEWWRQRQSFHKHEKSITLSIKSVCRRMCPLPDDQMEIDEDTGRKIFKKNPEADTLYAALIDEDQSHPLYAAIFNAVAPFLIVRATLYEARLRIEKGVLPILKTMPGYNFCVETPGISPMFSFAVIGETPGDNDRGVADFDTKYRLWKRFGLSVMPDGLRQRKLKGKEGGDHGYSPQRRSVIWTFGDAILKTAHSPYAQLYQKIRVNEIQKWNARNLFVMAAADIRRLMKKEEIAARQSFFETLHEKEMINAHTTINMESEFRNKKHFRNHCKRLMEKQLLDDYRVAYRNDLGIIDTI